MLYVALTDKVIELTNARTSEDVLRLQTEAIDLIVEMERNNVIDWKQGFKEIDRVSAITKNMLDISFRKLASI